MVCPACGYVLDVFDKGCPKCRDTGVAPAPAQGAVDAPPTPPPGTLAPAASRPYGLQVAGGLVVVLGLLCAVYYFRYYDTSLFVPAAALGGTGGGSGRLVPHDTFLMAERQNGILMGVGLAILGAVLFGIGQYLPQPDAFAPAHNDTPQPQPIAPKTDGDLWFLYALSVLLPLGGVVLILVNRDKPQRAGAAAIGTALGVVLGVSLWLAFH